MDANAPMTDRQRETLTFIRGYRDEHGCTPTLQEIADRFSIAKVSAFERVDQLIARKLLTRVPNARRGLALADQCPCCGHKLAS